MRSRRSLKLSHTQTSVPCGTLNTIRDARTPQPGDARTPQPGEIIFNTMRYRSSETVQRSGHFESSVSYIKVQIM